MTFESMTFHKIFPGKGKEVSYVNDSNLCWLRREKMLGVIIIATTTVRVELCVRLLREI